MNTDEHQHLTRLQLYETGEYACSYLPQKRARSQMIAPADAVNANNYQNLLDQGFRRSGLYVYRPKCHHCTACQSMRIVVDQFVPSRSQRRAKSRWSALAISVHDLEFSNEHFKLYQHYQNTRHSEGEMAQDDEAQYRQFLLKSQVNSLLIEFRDISNGNRLVMVSAIDQTTFGLSAVYTFFETDPQYSGLGTYNVLWQIDLALRMGLPYVYLGYWIEDCPKMSYKSKFAAAEVLRNGVWMKLSETC
jgi:arginine-tRNA-protein transferase